MFNYLLKLCEECKLITFFSHFDVAINNIKFKCKRRRCFFGMKKIVKTTKCTIDGKLRKKM